MGGCVEVAAVCVVILASCRYVSTQVATSTAVIPGPPQAEPGIQKQHCHPHRSLDSVLWLSRYFSYLGDHEHTFGHAKKIETMAIDYGQLRHTSVYIRTVPKPLLSWNESATLASAGGSF
jgi:hypothetical protein